MSEDDTSATAAAGPALSEGLGAGLESCAGCGAPKQDDHTPGCPIMRYMMQGPAALLAAQRPPPPDIAKVLGENLGDLYSA